MLELTKLTLLTLIPFAISYDYICSHAQNVITTIYRIKTNLIIVLNMQNEIKKKTKTTTPVFFDKNVLSKLGLFPTILTLV